MTHNATLANEIDALAGTWRRFCDQPFATKFNHRYTKAGGYEYKDDVDYKENFHLSLLYEGPSTLTEVDTLFIDQGKRFIELSAPFVYKAADVLSDSSGVDFSFMVRESLPDWQLRHLHYFPRTIKQIERGDKLLAEEHVDYFFTIHWFEDGTGFQVYWNEQWRNVYGKRGSLTAYPGLNVQYYSKCQLVGTCHRVRVNRLTELNGRYSIVSFIPVGSLIFDKATYGSTQSYFPGGKNYKIPFQEFAKHFVPMQEQRALV